MYKTFNLYKDLSVLPFIMNVWLEQWKLASMRFCKDNGIDHK
jgi:hypothetical protein